MELTSSNLIIAENFSRITSYYETNYEENKALFWLIAVFYLVLALVAVIGNGLVLYASYGTTNCGPLRHLDDAIKSLAVADLLFGLLGTPFLIYLYYMGE